MGTSTPRLRRWQGLFALLAIEGVLSVAASFASPSMSRRALYLGFSLPRLSLQVLLSLAAVFVVYVAIRSIVRPTWLSNGIASFYSYFSTSPPRSAILFASLVSATILGAYFAAMFHFALASNAPSLIRAAVQHFAPVLLWFFSIPIQLAVGLALDSPAMLRSVIPGLMEARHQLLFLLIILAGALQCGTLLLRADWLFRIPGWFWEPTAKQYHLQYILFFPIALLAIVGVHRILRGLGAPAYNIILSVGILFLLQLAFGIAAGGGFDSLRAKYASAPISHEVRAACEYPAGARAAVRNYEVNFADDFWLGTKPPGLLAALIGVRDLTRAISPKDLTQVDDCFTAVTQVMAYLFPLLASLVVLPIYAIERSLGEGTYPHDSAVLYMSVPSVLLMPLIRDQSLYPLVTAFCVAIAVKATLAKSLPLAIAAGLLVYMSAFLSFSLIPIAALVIAFPILSAATSSRNTSISEAAILVLGITLGIVFAWLAINSSLQYDLTSRYAAAMDLHRSIKGYQSDLSSLRQYTLLNNIEFAMATGAPLLLLFATSSVASARRVLRQTGTHRDSFTIALLLTFAALNLLGQTRGEVARLWIFLLPPIAVVAISEARQLTRPRDTGIQTAFALQLLLAFFTFMNMDFR